MRDLKYLYDKWYGVAEKAEDLYNIELQGTSGLTYMIRREHERVENFGGDYQECMPKLFEIAIEKGIINGKE